MNRFIVALFILVLLPVYAVAELSVWFLDVGQGDCTIVICDDTAMIIDGGPPGTSDKVYTFLEDLGLEQLDYMVSTHPHEDHLGGLLAALQALPVENILMPVTEWNSRRFERFLEFADIRESRIIVPYEGQQFPLGGAVVTVLHCWPESLEEHWGSVDPENDMSIVVRIDYGDTSLIVTGDAESASEYMMIDSGLPLRADVLRVAHHGSTYSTTEQFLEAVSPRYAVISCGKGNGYYHPHGRVLNLLEKYDVWVFRTDLQGTVRMVSDGKELKFSVGRWADKEDLYTASAPTQEPGV